MLNLINVREHLKTLSFGEIKHIFFRGPEGGGDEHLNTRQISWLIVY